MNIITLDFETYFDNDYSSSKLSTEEYVRDPRFEVHGVGVLENGKKGFFTNRPTMSDPLYGNEIQEFFDRIKWEETAVLCHHAHFDGLILSHHYGIKPAFWLDTLSMARMVHGNHISASLQSLSSLYGLTGKHVPYDLFKGRHWSELDDTVQSQLSLGCLHDVELCWRLFNRMSPDFPAEEYALIDLTIRMFTEPVLQGDIDLLGEIWYEERDKKTRLLSSLGVSAEDLQSSDKFAALLRSEGIEPETKLSPKGNTIFAFAKTDDFMRELRESENDKLASLAEARLNLKSTLNQTRAETIGGSASRGCLPIYLSYCAAHTTRWGGGDNINWQNLPRNGKLRKSLVAPKGYKICVVDLSQVECRLLNTLAGQQDVIETFRKGEDPYVRIASSIYGRPINKTDHPNERGTGKQAELSCGYGCGPDKFKATARLGIYGPPVILSDGEARHAVEVYRKTHQQVTSYWALASRMIARLAGGDPLDWGPMLIKDKRLWLPNGSCVIYDTLHFDPESREWRYQTRKGWNKLYGAKLCQHVCEALGRLILGQAALRLRARSYRMIMTVHDEGAFLIREDEEKEIILEEFERQVAWLPELPVKAEALVGERYEK